MKNWFKNLFQRPVFVIYRLYFDSLENEINAAREYRVEGYVTSETKAKRFVADSGYSDSKDCWAIRGKPRRPT